MLFCKKFINLSYFFKFCCTNPATNPVFKTISEIVFNKKENKKYFARQILQLVYIILVHLMLICQIKNIKSIFFHNTILNVEKGWVLW